MKIKAKILSGYFLLLFFASIVAFIALYGFNEMKNDYQSIIAIDDTAIIQLREIQYYFTGQANDERGFLLSGKPEFRTEITEKSQQIKQRIETLRNLARTEQEKELLAKIDLAHSKFTQVNFTVIDLYSAGKLEEAKQLSFGDGRTTRKTLETAFNELVKINTESAKARMTSAEERVLTLLLLILGLAIGMIVAGTVIGLATAQRITKPISRLSQELKIGRAHV